MIIFRCSTIHIISAVLVYIFVLLTFRTPFFQQSRAHDLDQRFIALCSSLLFVAHPVQTQAVTYISQRFTSLAAMLYLLAMVLYIKFRLSERRVRFGLYAASLLSAVLAMKTKEISFTLPFTIILYEACFLTPPAPAFIAFRSLVNRERLLQFLPFLLAMLIIPLSLLGPDIGLFEPGENIDEHFRAMKFREATSLSRSDYLLTQFRVIATYLRLLVLPIDQNLDYDYSLSTSLLSLDVLASLLLILLLIGAACRSFILSRTGNPVLRLVAFGGLFFFITLSVEAGLVPIKDMIFEHRIYLPSIGFFVAVMAYLYASVRQRMDASPAGGRIVVMLFLTVLMAFSGAAYARNGIWETQIGLWQDVIEKSPEKARAHTNLGLAFQEAGQIDHAVKEYRAAILIKDDPVAHYNLGYIYIEQGKIEEAIGEYKTALSIKPDYADAHNNLGNIYMRIGLLGEAAHHYKTAALLYRNNGGAYANLGTAYEAMGRYEEALSAYEEALRLEPHDVLVYEKMQSVKRRVLPH